VLDTDVTRDMTLGTAPGLYGRKMRGVVCEVWNYDMYGVSYSVCVVYMRAITL
jgi:hypothetical protein